MRQHGTPTQVRKNIGPRSVCGTYGPKAAARKRDAAFGALGRGAGMVVKELKIFRLRLVELQKNKKGELLFFGESEKDFVCMQLFRNNFCSAENICLLMG